jgi:hypothetical protein
MWHAWGRGKMHTGLWWGSELNVPLDLSVGGAIILEWVLKK